MQQNDSDGSSATSLDELKAKTEAAARRLKLKRIDFEELATPSLRTNATKSRMKRFVKKFFPGGFYPNAKENLGVNEDYWETVETVRFKTGDEKRTLRIDLRDNRGGFWDITDPLKRFPVNGSNPVMLHLIASGASLERISKFKWKARSKYEIERTLKELTAWNDRMDNPPTPEMVKEEEESEKLETQFTRECEEITEGLLFSTFKDQPIKARSATEIYRMVVDYIDSVTDLEEEIRKQLKALPDLCSAKTLYRVLDTWDHERTSKCFQVLRREKPKKVRFIIDPTFQGPKKGRPKKEDVF